LWWSYRDRCQRHAKGETYQQYIFETEARESPNGDGPAAQNRQFTCGTFSNRNRDRTFLLRSQSNSRSAAASVEALSRHPPAVQRTRFRILPKQGVHPHSLPCLSIGNSGPPCTVSREQTKENGDGINTDKSRETLPTEPKDKSVKIRTVSRKGKTREETRRDLMEMSDGQLKDLFENYDFLDPLGHKTRSTTLP
jgi:uncharacterized protein YjiS (DUF1127 family)